MDIPKPNEVIATQEAQSFVINNTVEAKKGRMCVDGRYLSEGQQKGFLARAGGDFGYVMGLLALVKEGKINLTISECVDTVYNFVTKDGDKCHSHTDEHSIHDNTLTGCGHAGKASDPQYAELFGVAPDDVVEALTYFRDKVQHPLTEETLLSGNHGEQGVLIISGKDKTVRHQDANGSQYFIYDKDRDNEFVDNFVNSVNIQGLNSEDLKRVLEKQTNATLRILAPNSPIFSVNFDGKSPTVNYVGNVQPLETAS